MPSSQVRIHQTSPADMIDLTERLERFRVLLNEDDGPFVGLGIDPDSGRETLIWHSDLPSQIVAIGNGVELAASTGGTNGAN